MNLPTSLSTIAFAVTDNAVDDEETIGSLVLVTPLEHAIICHDFVESLVTNLAFESYQPLGCIGSPFPKEFCILDLCADLFSFFIFRSDEGSADDRFNIYGG